MIKHLPHFVIRPRITSSKLRRFNRPSDLIRLLKDLNEVGVLDRIPTCCLRRARAFSIGTCHQKQVRIICNSRLGCTCSTSSHSNLCIRNYILNTNLFGHSTSTVCRRDNHEKVPRLQMLRHTPVRIQRSRIRIRRVHRDQVYTSSDSAIDLQNYLVIGLIPPVVLRVSYRRLLHLRSQPEDRSITIWLQKENTLPKVLRTLISTEVASTSKSSYCSHFTPQRVLCTTRCPLFSLSHCPCS